MIPQTITMVPVEDLTPAPGNAKDHPGDQVALLAAAITEFGFTNPLLVTADREVVAGHGRLLAAKSIGMAEVPCILLGGFTAGQVKALRLSDNKIAELGDWNLGKLSAELESLMAEDEALLGLSGFNFEEIDEILKGLLTDGADPEKDVKPDYLTVAGHKVELRGDEKDDLKAMLDGWVKERGSYDGLVANLMGGVK